jgi:hypothetical protein
MCKELRGSNTLSQRKANYLAGAAAEPAVTP